MELFRLFGSIMIDDKDAIKALKNAEDKGKNAEKTLSKSFGAIGSAAKIAGAAIATGVTAVLASGVSGAMEAEDSLAQLNAVLESTGGAAGVSLESLTGLADELERTTKFSAESTQAAESLLLTFTNIGADVFPNATKTAADMAQALGTDMSSQATALGKALNDPINGISALSRVGVTFTDEQKAQIKAMQEAGDVAGAQTIILNELNKEFGGSAEAAGGTFSGQLEITKNALGAVSESLVTGLMPYLQSFLDWVLVNMPTIQATASSVLEGVTAAFGWVQDKANILIPILAGVLGGFVAFQIVSTISAAFTVLTGVMTAVSTAGGILNAILAVNPLVLIALAIAAVIAAGVLLVMNWDKVKKKAEEVWEGIKAAFGGVGKFFTDIWDNVSQTFTKIGSTIGDAIGGAFKTVVNTIIGFAEGKINGFIGAINGAIGLINKIPGVSIKELSELKIPRMAKGGVVTSPTFAQIGEDGAEAVMPLEKNTGWIDNLAARINSKGGGRTDELLEIIISMLSNSKIEWNDRELGRMVRNYV